MKGLFPAERLFMRRLIFPVAAAALCVTGVAAPAWAQTPDQDVRCLLASNVFATSEKDPTKKKIAQTAALFYLGRLDARLSLAELKSRILVDGKAMTGTNVGEVMTNCAKQLQTKQRALQAMSEEIAKSQKK